jgi:four helix bundle protein
LRRAAVEEAMVNFIAFYKLRWGSASELEYHLLLSKDLKFLNADIYLGLNSQVEEVKRMLSSLARKVDEERSKFRG